MKRRVLPGLSRFLLIPLALHLTAPAAYASSNLGDPQPLQTIDAPPTHPTTGGEPGIPEKPSAPPSLFKRTAPETFRCQRLFTFEGRTYGCDSNVRADGEGLRAFVKDVPEANAQLNAYQSRRSALQATAFTGSLGLAILISGLVGGGGTGKQVLVLSGVTIFGGSFLYGFTAAKANESKLDDVVRLHNQAKPDQPIDLQFSTGVSF